MTKVGRGDLDHAYWGRHEEMTMDRPAYKLNSTKPGSDLAGEMAAAMAAGSIAFRTTGFLYCFLYIHLINLHFKALYM